jgi:hypothetical protein
MQAEEILVELHHSFKITKYLIIDSLEINPDCYQHTIQARLAPPGIPTEEFQYFFGRIENRAITD